ncbi:glutathione S-transferase [Hahella sp. CCB-MM4]|uniref:glutathione S-transferase n=1 Tax=Hahella sp. (strain CCB-MM4) TaxID=1926491 RepID=UPI000B9B02BD|nr:glutathione S-transferase [Hahella sp. CCB-MM4]OZG74556.1 glutathione S-transferase [Hahella sp. CCB-MM4]
MKLIGSYTSPFVRKIRVMLLEKGIPFSLLEDLPWSEDSKAPQYNPLGKVPILIDEQGKTWFDSPVIAEYIEALHTKHMLIPPGKIGAVEVRQLEALADGIVEAGIAIFLEQKRATEMQNPEWLTRQHGKIKRGIDALENILGDNLWLHAETFSLADISVGVILEWLNFRLPDLGWQSDAPKLTAYLERLRERPSFQETRPPEI